MKGKTTIQTKLAESFTSNTPGLPASFPPVFSFDEIIVTINSGPFAIISTSSAIVDDCERSISIPWAIKGVNESIISAIETIIPGTPAITSRAQIVVCEMQTIVSITETLISGDPQDPANDRVPDGSPEMIISELETTVCRADAIISALQISISEAKAVIYERVLAIDGTYTVISGPHSIICTYEATMSVVETIISATEIDFSMADTIVSAFPTSFFAAQLIISAAEKTAGAVPAGLFPNHQPTRR